MKRIFTLSLLVLLLSLLKVSAQTTSSSIVGDITEGGEPLIGATVVAEHTPSGSTYGAITNADGRYNLQGLRTGGPYTVTVSFIGYEEMQFTGINLSLGSSFRQDADMHQDSEKIDDIVVVSDARVANSAQNFDISNIENTPTVTRNVYDVIKNMPMVGNNKGGGISFAGTNNRYNSFQIDGTVSNDVFGLSSGGTNGDKTGANPISMDAIQEIQVVIAPYDVRQGGFTGGGINAVTKQGDNTFHASAYTYYNDQDFYGSYSAVRGQEAKLTEQLSQTLGGSASGPIIKNKLFYFVNVENINNTKPLLYSPGSIDGFVTEEEAQKVADKFEEYTGIKETFGSNTFEQAALSMLARLDWNINEDHKLTFRYQGNRSYKDSDWANNNRTYQFKNSGDRINNRTHSFVTELTSNFGSEWHNELRASYTKVSDERSTAYKSAEVIIKALDEDRDVELQIGMANVASGNHLYQDTYTIEDNLSWYQGDHTITFGTHNEFYTIQNLYMPCAFGQWTFDTVEDFMNDNASQYTHKYSDPNVPSTGGSTLWAPTMNFAQFGLYAQDKWDLNRNFNLTYGIRLDVPMSLEQPTENKEYNDYAEANDMAGRTGVAPKTQFLFSPRAGFRWYANDSHSTLLRGGAGIFTGRVPFVWVSNPYNNNGVEQKGTTIYGSDTNPVPSFEQYHDDAFGATASGIANRSGIVTIDENFTYPQVARTNLALEQQLPGGVKMTLEGIYSKTLNNILVSNEALKQTGTIEAITGVEASAVPFYTNETAYNSAIHTSNTNKGYSYALSALLEKGFANGLGLSASYTFSRAKSVNDGYSSEAYSNWQYNYSQDLNTKTELGYSKYDVPHRLTLQASYSTPKYLSGLMQTNFGVVYNGFSGTRYCLSMGHKFDKGNLDFNGDNSYGATLLYIPTVEEIEKMNFSSEDDRKLFADWIANDKYTSTHRGQFAERYSNATPWENHIDLHMDHNIFYNKERGGKIQISFDVVNFANLLNKEWGVSYYVPYNISPVYTVRDSNNKISHSYNSYNTVQKDDITSRWSAKVGLKVTF